MKYKIVGAGYSGSTFARILNDSGFNVEVFDKALIPGGLSITKKSEYGFLYEPYGARTFHTKFSQVKEFITKYTEFSDYTHHKGTIIEGVLRHFPINYETIKAMPQADKILKELNNRPAELDKTNFETCMVSLLGDTLYKLFIYGYTGKMWGIEPQLLTSQWAPARIELHDTECELFKNQWQGIPINGYTEMFKHMLSGIKVNYGVDLNIKDYKYNNEIILYSGKIDELFEYKYGKLPYRSIEFTYKTNEFWEHPNYGSINLPEHEIYFRKANYAVLYQRNNPQYHNIIQYQKSISHESTINPPMYPINTKENNDIFDKYLREACKNDNIIPIGRLGLYKYLDMDKAILLVFKMKELILNWQYLSADTRYKQMSEILKNIT